MSFVKTASKYFTIDFQYFKRISTSFDETYFPYRGGPMGMVYIGTWEYIL